MQCLRSQTYTSLRKDRNFLRSTLNALDSFSEGTLVTGGDFNVPLDLKLDTSSGTMTLPDYIIRGTRALLREHQLSDCWRTLHCVDKDYTFYSTAHKSYYRLDYFLMQHRNLDNLISVRIAPMTWSDHAPVTMSIRPPAPPKNNGYGD
ncbi:Hypothetical predicted protein [Pelobates cultripes]|uniref:Endonuclease/exonuclease/phosphatase domain-containing protein n=1 Tax=Pelobates cultripes TaxID=61616 RepID=A0AAD1VS99_PELCU|nr:Hypothetical predicted protein [Pelobates cultripes]